VSSPADLYTLQFEQIVDLEGFAELSSKNLLQAIADSKRPTLARFIYALGIPDVGKRLPKCWRVLWPLWSVYRRPCRKC
jgi:NAD-dependent DNA ligase (contains BRCT domain type II)